MWYTCTYVHMRNVNNLTFVVLCGSEENHTGVQQEQGLRQQPIIQLDRPRHLQDINQRSPPSSNFHSSLSLQKKFQEET